MEPIINWEMELESEGLKLNKFQRVYLSLKKKKKCVLDPPIAFDRCHEDLLGANKAHPN